MDVRTFMEAEDGKKNGRTQALLEKGMKRQTNTMWEKNERLRMTKKRENGYRKKVNGN